MEKQQKKSNSARNILLAFLLNLFFAVFELFGGLLTGSVAILSDSLHDTGDALSIGLSYFLEKKSLKKPDETYTYGYARYSVVGGLLTTLILILGSLLVMYHAVGRIISPAPINYDGMILFAVIGIVINTAATLLTRGGGSLNQKSVNLHMLEDVLGWAVILIGSVVIKLTGFVLLDPLMSIGVGIFILFHAVKHLTVILRLFLEKLPDGICVGEIQAMLSEIDGVVEVHHIHVRSIDNVNHCATMHVVTNKNPHEVKRLVREALISYGIRHVTLEMEEEGEVCADRLCYVVSEPSLSHGCGHHHHHHHHKHRDAHHDPLDK